MNFRWSIYSSCPPPILINNVIIFLSRIFLEQFTENLNFPESIVPLCLSRTASALPYQFPLLLTSCLSGVVITDQCQETSVN